MTQPLNEKDRQEYQAWMEWKKTCAVDACSPENSAVLKKRFSNSARIYPHIISAYGEPYAVFEAHCYLHKNKQGKNYKEHLFQKAMEDTGQVSIKCLRGYAKRYLISAIGKKNKDWENKSRPYARDGEETDESNKLDRSAADAHKRVVGFGFPDTIPLPDKMHIATSKEQENIAKITERVCAVLSATEKKVMLAIAAGLRPTGAEFLSLAQKSTSTLNEAVKNLSRGKKIKREIISQVGNITPEEREELTQKVARCVRDNIHLWMKKNETDPHLRTLLDKIEPYRDNMQLRKDAGNEPVPGE